jgi:hypothetical protein
MARRNAYRRNFRLLQCIQHSVSNLEDCSANSRDKVQKSQSKSSTDMSPFYNLVPLGISFVRSHNAVQRN